VGGEEVVGERVEWGYGGGKEEKTTGDKRGDAPPLGLVSADSEAVRDAERKDRQGRLKVERPGVGIRPRDGATLGMKARA
jgi:hypothetical protein